MASEGMTWPWATTALETPSTSSKGCIFAQSPAWQSWKASRCLMGRGESSAQQHHADGGYQNPQLGHVWGKSLCRWEGQAALMALEAYILFE